MNNEQFATVQYFEILLFQTIPQLATTFYVAANISPRVVRYAATDLFYPYMTSLNMKFSWSSDAMADVREPTKSRIKNVQQNSQIDERICMFVCI